MSVAKIFRFDLEVANLEEAAAFYGKLLGIEGKTHPGARHYINCGGVILQILDVARGGVKPTPCNLIYFAVDELASYHARAKAMNALAPYQVHGEPAGDIVERPWGEKSFYAVDPWGNDVCFCEDGTLYT